MKKFFIGNWKMNPQTGDDALELFRVADKYFSEVGNNSNLDLIFCPPYVFLDLIHKNLDKNSSFYLGAQDLAVNDSGAFTGEISGPMLKNIGTDYVIIGHSERRWKIGESSDTVNKKLKSAIRNNLIPIVCVGEKLRGNDREIEIREQVDQTFQDLNLKDFNNLFVAYEPVWAISSNSGAEVDNPDNAAEAMIFIRDYLDSKFNGIGEKIKCIYGGSVDATNVQSFIDKKIFDGVLVGGASINIDRFSALISILDQITRK